MATVNAQGGGARPRPPAALPPGRDGGRGGNGAASSGPLRAGCLGIGGIALGIALWSAVPALAAPRPAEGPVISSPHAGATTGRIVRVAVRAGDLPGDLRVVLNGRDVTAAFGWARSGRRSAVLSLTHGLRHGRNVMRARVRLAGGRLATQVVRFRVPRAVTLPGAGWDRRVAAREPVTLTGALAPTGGATGHSWRLVSVPRGSRQEPGPLPEADPGGAPRTTLTPDVAGTYRVRLSVLAGSRTPSDDVLVTAVPPQPLVPVDAGAEERGLAGVRVGGRFYAAGGGGNWLQVVVLDRRTLALTSNTTYNCFNQVQQADCAEAVAKVLRALDDTHLVIGRYPGGPDWTRNFGFAAALAPIGVADEPRPILPASAIGVPGAARGQAFQSFQVKLGDPQGGIRGYLTPDAFGNYRFVNPDHLGVDTRARGSSPTRNVIRVGDRRFTGDLPDGAGGGYHLLVLDRPRAGTQAKPLQDAVFATNQADPAAGVRATHALLQGLRSAAEADTLVMLVSLGRPGFPATAEGRAQAMQLGPAVQRVGGTSHVLFSAAERGAPYSLLGSGRGREASGEESSPVVARAQADGAISAELGLDHTMKYAVRMANPAGEVSTRLSDVAFQAPTRWPFTTQPAERAALAYVEARIGVSDLRTAYWLKDVSDEKWAQYQRRIESLPLEAGDGFTAADLKRVRDGLADEIGRVISVRSLMSALSRPFSDAGLSSWAAFTQIAGEIDRDVKADPKRKRAIELSRQIFDDVLHLPVPGSSGKDFVVAAWDIAMHIATADGAGDDADRFQVEVGRLGVKTAARLEAGRQAFASLADIIVADPARLATVAAWEDRDRTDGARASAALLISLRRFAYSTLLPAKVSAWSLPVSAATDARTYRCTRRVREIRITNRPFRDVPAGGQLAALVSPPGGPASYRVVALANLDTDPPEVPAASIMTTLFTPPDPAGDPRKGGLGLVPAFFFPENWTISAFGMPAPWSCSWP